MANWLSELYARRLCQTPLVGADVAAEIYRRVNGVCLNGVCPRFGKPRKNLEKKQKTRKIYMCICSGDIAAAGR